MTKMKAEKERVHYVLLHVILSSSNCAMTQLHPQLRRRTVQPPRREIRCVRSPSPSCNSCTCRLWTLYCPSYILSLPLSLLRMLKRRRVSLYSRICGRIDGVGLYVGWQRRLACGRLRVRMLRGWAGGRRETLVSLRGRWRFWNVSWMSGNGVSQRGR